MVPKRAKSGKSATEKAVHALAGRGGGAGNGETQAGVHRHVPIDKVEISERPNRAHIDVKAPGFLELVESIKATGGVIQPILVRPLDGAKMSRFELVAGERRLKAAKAAGRRTISCMVRAMTDAEASASQLTENVHRADLTPLEEAAQVRAMLEAGSTTAEIAQLLGRTPRYVQRRASLVRLSKGWQKEAAKASWSAWPAICMEKVARLSEGLQKKLLDQTYYQAHGPDEDYIDRAIGNLTHELKRAAWKLDDATLDPKAGPCSECRNRAGQQPLLWDSLADLDMADAKALKSDVCLDPKCWECKLAAWLTRKEKELRDEHGEVVPITSFYYSQRKGAVCAHNLAKAKKTDKKAKPGLVIDGPAAGTVRWVKVPKTGAAPTGLTRGPSPLKERRKKLKDRREAWVIDDVKKALNLFGFPELGIDDCEHEQVLLRLVATFGTEPLDGTFKDYGANDSVLHEDLCENLWGHIKCNIPCWTLPSAKELAEFLGLEFSDLVEKAEREIPEPKSWARLNADGTPKTAAKPAKKKAKKADAGKVKRAKFTVAKGPAKWNDCNVCTSGYETIDIPIRKTAKGSLRINVVASPGPDHEWLAAQNAECDSGGHSSPLSLKGTSYQTREGAILAVLKEEAGCSQCGEHGSKAAQKRARMMTEDIKAFLEAATADATYLYPLEPKKTAPFVDPNICGDCQGESGCTGCDKAKALSTKKPKWYVCRGCGCTSGTPCLMPDGTCSWVIAPGTPEAKEKGPLCSACAPADGKPKKRKKKAG